MAAAVVELNSLPDAVRTAAENDDFLFRRGRSFVFVLVGRVKIRRVAFEFGGAGLHALVHRLKAMLLALMTNFFLITFAAQSPGSGEASVGESHAFGITQNFGWHRLHGMLYHLELHVVI